MHAPQELADSLAFPLLQGLAHQLDFSAYWFLLVFCQVFLQISFVCGKAASF